MSLLDTCTNPHGINFMSPNLQSASLDHAMWFHRPFKSDEWLLYSQDSPSASGARVEPTLSKSTLPPALFISVAIEADKLVNEPLISDEI